MKRRIILVIVVVIALGVGIRYAVSVRGNRAGGTYQFVEVTRGDLENVISSSGTLEPVSAVEVGTQVSGTIDRMDVDFNDTVHKGQVLAVLDTALLSLAVQDAQAGLMRAQAQLDQAQGEYDRSLPLLEKGHLSESEFLPIRVAVKTAHAAVQSAQVASQRAQRNMRYAIVRSPINGTVIQRNVEPGQTVAASLQAPTLFIIAEDLSQMEIHAQVDESDIGQIKEGQSVRFTVQAYPDERFQGTVRQVRLQPTTVQSVVNYTVIADAPNRGGLLLPGMTATVDFVVEELKDVLLVPNAALRFEPTEEMLAEFRERTQNRPGQRARQAAGPQDAAQGAPAQASSSGEPAGNNIARLWVLDAKGDLDLIPVRKGSTDGIVTQVTGLLPTGRHPTGTADPNQGPGPRVVFKEGMQVISGVAQPAQPKANSNQRSLLPGPPFGGR